MLCLNAPRKPMAKIHILISLFLVIACTALAFMPLTKIVVTDETKDAILNLFEYIESQNTGEDAAAKNAKIDKMIESLDLDHASVGLSVLNMAKSAKETAKIGEMIVKMLEAKDDASKLESMSTELLGAFMTDDGSIRPELKDFVITVAALVGPMIPADPSGMSEDGIGDMVAAGFPAMMGVFAAVLLSVILPIVFAILFLVTLITALTGLKDPVIGSAKLAKRAPKSVVHPISVILVTCLTSSVAPTALTFVMLGLAAAGTLANILFTRLHGWDAKEIKFANAVQFASLASIGAYVFFFINLIKMGVLRSFVSKLIPFFVSGKTATAAVYTDIAMIVLAVFFALLSSKYLAKVMRRASLACSPKRKGGAHSVHLVRALFLFAVPVLPMMALGSTANGGRAFLSVSPSQEYALLFGFIAVAVMVLSEIVLLILRGVFGKGLTKVQVGDILTDVSEAESAVSPEAASAEAPAFEESAEAAVKVEEPAPATEAPSEPAIAEENAAPAEAPAEKSDAAAESAAPAEKE